MNKMIHILIALALTLSLAACGQGTATWQEQYDLGVRYLSEGSYEEAIIAFTAAIEIDEKNYDAYISLARAYLAIEDLQSAASILENGYDLLDSQGITALDDFISQHQELLLDGNPVTASDFIVNGKPISMCTLLDFQSAYPSDPDEDWYEPLEEAEYHGQMGITYAPSIEHFTGWIWTWAASESAFISIAVFDEFDYAAFDFREIAFDDSLSTVLTKIGVSSLGKKFLEAASATPRIRIYDDSSWKFDLSEQVQNSTQNELTIWDYQHGNWLLLQFEDDRLNSVQYALLS